MKKFIRRPAVQAILGWILAAYMSLIRHSVRWRHEGLEKVAPVLRGEAGVVALLWHGRIPVALTIAPVLKQTKLAHCLVSPSADGEFFAQAMAHNGFPSIRASSAKKGDSAPGSAAVANPEENYVAAAVKIEICKTAKAWSKTSTSCFTTTAPSTPRSRR